MMNNSKHRGKEFVGLTLASRVHRLGRVCMKDVMSCSFWGLHSFGKIFKMCQSYVQGWDLAIRTVFACWQNMNTKIETCIFFSLEKWTIKQKLNKRVRLKSSILRCQASIRSYFTPYARKKIEEKECVKPGFIYDITQLIIITAMNTPTNTSITTSTSTTKGFVLLVLVFVLALMSSGNALLQA